MSLTDEDKQWIESRLQVTEDRLIEIMRGMQTELLKGFEGFAASQAIRIRKVEADQSNLDAALSARVAILEKRLLEIETKLDHTK
jgi:hypothetical protein